MNKFIEVISAQDVRMVIRTDSILEIKSYTNDMTNIKLSDGSSHSVKLPYHEIVKMVADLDVEAFDINSKKRQ